MTECSLVLFNRGSFRVGGGGGDDDGVLHGKLGIFCNLEPYIVESVCNSSDAFLITARKCVNFPSDSKSVLILFRNSEDRNLYRKQRLITMLLQHNQETIF